MKIREILDRAVGLLWDGDQRNGKGEEFSCHAILFTMRDIHPFYLAHMRWLDINIWLSEMGLNPDGSGEFAGVPKGPQRQYARALWLTWAALMAEEQGL